MTRRAAKRRPMVNEEVYTDPRKPDGWGPADALPCGAPRTITKSTVLLMFERETLNADQLQAATEIERIFGHITARLFTKSQKFEQTASGVPIDAPEWMLRAYKDRYLPWAKMLNKYDYGRETNLSYAISVIIDGARLKDLEAENKWRKGTASLLIRDALSCYVALGTGGSRRAKHQRVA